MSGLVRGRVIQTVNEFESLEYYLLCKKLLKHAINTWLLFLRSCDFTLMIFVSDVWGSPNFFDCPPQAEFFWVSDHLDCSKY